MSPYYKPPQQPFVYGTFLWPVRASALYGVADSGPDIALEILREFGASEFVAKLYTKLYSGEWAIGQFPAIRQTNWYQAFGRFQKNFVFEMQGAGPWEVLHFRIESDESGSYVAVALHQFERNKVPQWVSGVRKRLGLERL